MKLMSTFIAVFIISFSTFIHAQVEENAALIYWKATAVMAEFPKDLAPEKIIAEGIKLDDKCLKLLHDNLGSVDEVMKASRLKVCHFILPSEYEEGYKLLLPHLAKLRTLGSIVVLDGIRCVQQGNIEGAVDRYIAAIRLGYHIQEDPCLITSIVSQKIMRTAMTEMLKIMQEPGFKVEYAIKLKSTLEEIAPQIEEMIPRALSSEIYLLVPYKKAMSSQDPQRRLEALRELWMMVKDYTYPKLNEKEKENIEKTCSKTNGLSDKLEEWTEEQRTLIANVLKIPVQVLESNQSFCTYAQQGIEEHDKFILNLTTAVKKTCSETKKYLESLEKEIADGNLILRITVPKLSHLIYRLHFGFISYFRMMRLVTDIAIYHKNKGAFPKSLDELDIKGLLDPTTGNPFSYTVSESKVELKGEDMMVEYMVK